MKKKMETTTMGYCTQGPLQGSVSSFLLTEGQNKDYVVVVASIQYSGPRFSV